MNDLFLTTSDGEQLEAIHDRATDSRGAIVLCHPHPLHGGTMTGPLIQTIARRVVESGLDVVRFNFRGVGRSTGTHDNGINEINDVDAAVQYASKFGGLAGIVGWSFGAVLALIWHTQNESTVPYVGIAPPIKNDLSPSVPSPDDMVAAKRSIIVGQRDQLIVPAQVALYAESISAELVTYRGSDHFFVLRHDHLARDVIRLLTISQS